MLEDALGHLLVDELVTEDLNAAQPRRARIAHSLEARHKAQRATRPQPLTGLVRGLNDRIRARVSVSIGCERLRGCFQ